VKKRRSIGRPRHLETPTWGLVVTRAFRVQGDPGCD
jgi:hypothetical protein